MSAVLRRRASASDALATPSRCHMTPIAIGPLIAYDDAAARDAVVAATRTWIERAVIGLNLCPFAKAAYVKQRMRYVVTAAADVDRLHDELTRELELLAGCDAQSIETTLLIHPRTLNDFTDYYLFVARVDAVVKRLGLRGTIQVASFHPEYQFAGTTSDDVENYTNRSPYPMLHLLREESIDRAVAAFPDASTIVDANVGTLRRLGHDGWKRLWIPSE
jgi:hypothetical protein